MGTDYCSLAVNLYIRVPNYLGYSDKKVSRLLDIVFT